MKLASKDLMPRLIVYVAILNSLIVTPFWNKDGMIIPKLIIMFSFSMYLLPIIIANRQLIINSKILKITVISQLLLMVHSVLALILSSAPLEQQIFGRSGRGLGLITIYSLAVVFVATAVFMQPNFENKIVFGLVLSAFLSSIYSLLQSYGIDLLKWDSKTNGVIGTLGNPNFQSAFASMALVPSLLYFWNNRKHRFLAIFMFMFFSFTIFRTQSTQGIIAGFFSAFVAFAIFCWYRNRFAFWSTLISGSSVAIFALIGMLNMGPLSSYLYKVSIQSRGDFWRAAFNTANSHPIFGVGLDSFGDYFLKYRDITAADHSFAEYTDNAHNFFLEQAATGGYLFALINIFFVILVLLVFIKIQIISNRFNPTLVSLFAPWVAFQMTTVISPGNLVNMYWNAVISGAVVGLYKSFDSSQVATSIGKAAKVKNNSLTPSILLIAGFIFMLPVFNTDRMQLSAMKKGDANMVMKATYSYPESTIRYSLIGRELLDSGLTKQSLEISRSGVKFNPNSAGLWALILVNPSATVEERLIAKEKILQLDPLNTEVRNFNP
jgi:O-antigen ligase